jgi:hypothetical protein
MVFLDYFEGVLQMPDSYLLKGLTHQGIYVRRYLTENDVSGDSKSRVRVGDGFVVYSSL